MRFEWMREGPARACGSTCREWISASGPITADTAKDFETFLEGRDAKGATVVLDSGGGAVNASLELGRKFRELEIRTTVGRSVRLSGANSKRAKIANDGECASMCVFVMLGGVHRTVPAEARMSVHQIWPGNKRGDSSAESYTAEELVRIQRDVGRIASYTVEMGGDIGLFELAMKIPPWERLRSLSQAEMRRLRLQMLDTVAESASSGATAPVRPAPVTERSVGTDRGWTFADGRLSRRHAITWEGDEIGQFEVTLACETPGKLRVAYTDNRTIASDAPLRLQDVTLWFGRDRVAMKVQSSETGDAQDLRTSASGIVTVTALERMRDEPANALTIGTRTSDNLRTSIRVGSVGLAKAYEGLAADCRK
ncbi:hypothetical protein [Variibacter gotjawalensis]|nr:hypothetical protein [Variibacter gotjawalensis]NIK46012.1 hypothetical protein [Variibacter gotjawalensis]